MLKIEVRYNSKNTFKEMYEQDWGGGDMKLSEVVVDQVE